MRRSVSAFILAAGDNTRFDGQAKALLDLGGYTIIERIIQQVRDYRVWPYVVTHREDVALAGARNGALVFDPPRRGCTSETLLSTRPLWHGKVMILLGDVYFTEATFDAICKADKRLWFYSNMGEIYAVTFGPELYETVAGYLVEVIERTAAGEAGVNGKLWNVYRLSTGRPIGDHMFDRGLPNMHYICDKTSDVDSPEEYRALLNKLGVAKVGSA